MNPNRNKYHTADYALKITDRVKMFQSHPILTLIVVNGTLSCHQEFFVLPFESHMGGARGTLHQQWRKE